MHILILVRIHWTQGTQGNSRELLISTVYSHLLLQPSSFHYVTPMALACRALSTAAFRSSAALYTCRSAFDTCHIIDFHIEPDVFGL